MIYRAGVRLNPALLVMAMALGCSPAGSGAESPFDSDALLKPRVQPGLELRAFLNRDTVTDEESLKVAYFIVNGPLPTPFLNDPDRIRVSVEQADGRMAPVRSAQSVTRSFGRQVEMTLPSHGILGQVEDVRCIENAAYAPRGPTGTCELAYDLSARGAYRVIVLYMAPKQGPFAHPMIADTIPFVIR